MYNFQLLEQNSMYHMASSKPFQHFIGLAVKSASNTQEYYPIHYGSQLQQNI